MDDAIFDEVQEEDDNSGIWLSISDLMSGLLLFFVLLFVTVLLKLQEQQEQKINQRHMLIGTMIDSLSGNDIEVSVNSETGDVSVREGILFAERSHVLTKAGKEFLKDFIPLYSMVIFSQSDFEEEISRIIVEGHASSSGSDAENLQLSLLRANAVVGYILSDDLQFSSKGSVSGGFVSKLLPAGRGEIDADQTQNLAADRKVLFRFQFKGEEFIDILGDGNALGTEVDE